MEKLSPATYDLRLFHPGLLQLLAKRDIRPRAIGGASAKLFVVLLAWVPLVVVCALEGSLFGGPVPFARDPTVNVRLLVELPVLFAATAIATPLVARGFAYLDRANLIAPEHRTRFDSVVRSTLRAKDARFVPVLLFVIAIAGSWSELSARAVVEASWRLRDRDVTMAGAWYLFVARPIVYAQFLLWLYRFALWVRLLFATARWARLLPAHPDRYGGLAPLLLAHDGFVVIAFVVGADLASAVATRVIHFHATMEAYRVTIILIVVVTTLVMLAPLFLFAPGLYRAHVRAIHIFGGASTEQVRRVDGIIGAAAQSSGEPTAPDVVGKAFASHVQLDKSMNAIRGIHYAPIHRKTIVLFVAAVTLPFFVASLAQWSPAEVLHRVRGLLH